MSEKLEAAKPVYSAGDFSNMQNAWTEALERELALRAENERLRTALEWKPIETAPRDGSDIILYCPQGDGNPGSTYRVTVGRWEEDYGGVQEFRDIDGNWIGQKEDEGFVGWLSWDGGFSEDTMMPTHWMPLPEPPTVQ